MGIDLKSIELTSDAILGKAEPILVDARDNVVYENGKATDKTEGIKVVLALPSKKLERITLKVADENCVTLSLEEIDALNEAGSFVRVRVVNVRGKLYQDYTSKEVKLSATADKIEIIKSTEKATNTKS